MNWILKDVLWEEARHEISQISSKTKLNLSICTISRIDSKISEMFKTQRITNLGTAWF